MSRGWRPLLAAIALSVWVTGCAHVMAYNAAVDAERQGDLVTAAQKTVEAIEAEHNYPEARALFARLWPVTLNESLQRVVSAEQTQDWEAAVQRLQILEQIVRRATILHLDAPMESQSSRLLADKDRAADKLYRQAQGDEQAGRLREAATAFRRATTYVPNYRDAEARYAKNRSAAMVRVAVLPFDNESYYHSASEMLGDRLLNDLLKRQGEFLSIVDRQYLNTVVKESSLQASGLVDPTTAVRLGKLAGIRYIVVGRVSQVSATNPIDSREQCNASRLLPADRNIPAHMVYASYTLWRQTREVVLTASVQIIDVVDGTVAKAWTETERATDHAESVSNISGDRQALDSNLQHLATVSPYLKSHDSLLGEATSRLGRTFAERVAGHLN